MQRSKIQRELALSVQPSVDAAEGDGKAVSPTSQIYFAYSLICPDEQRLTMQAYKKPVLIEDVVRNAATILKADGRVTWLEVHAAKQKSNHNHSAFAEAVDSKAEGGNLK